VKVVITGGAGFLGQLLAHRLLADGELAVGPGRSETIEHLVLADARPPSDHRLAADARVEIVQDDITDVHIRQSIMDGLEVAVFHLAAMVSAGCEADFDGAFEVNVAGTRNVLEACRARTTRARLVFASSIAAFGGLAPAESVSDRTKLAPETTYGATKAIGELLVNDYTRKGFVDGRSARLPTVVIRPGPPNAAASGWVSAIFRERLDGRPAVVPVAEDLSLPIAGYRTVVENLIRLYAVASESLGADRALNLPSIDATPRTMMDALHASADRPLGTITVKPDPEIQWFFAGWAHHASFARATELGLVRDETIENIVRGYIDDFLAPVGS
jgi:nucleoside-diphosphate-sugar epimerase